MTAEERQEELLNRAGYTRTDIHSPNDTDYYDYHKCIAVGHAVKEKMKLQCYPEGIDYERFILHLTDVNDLLENALLNTLCKYEELRADAAIAGLIKEEE